MGAVTLMRTPAETALAQAFETAKGKLPGDRSAREKAFGDFIEVGLPHRRVEEFKYTDLRAALREAAPFARSPRPKTPRPRPHAGEGRSARSDALEDRDRQRARGARGVGSRPAAATASRSRPLTEAFGVGPSRC